MGQSVRTEYQNGVAILRLDRGVTNALDHDCVAELSEAVERVWNEPGTRGLVIGSSNDKFFSIGFDIPGLFDLDRRDFAAFYRAYNRFCIALYTLPKPTVAAITGHAIAGGCVITLCCDYRIISEGRNLMGLNEIKLGVPLPYPADLMLRELVGVRFAREILDSGEFYEPGDSVRIGLVDRVVPPEEVLPVSIRKAVDLGSLASEAFAMIKRNRVETTEEQIIERLVEKEERFLELWYSKEARERLREAIEKFRR